MQRKRTAGQNASDSALHNAKKAAAAAKKASTNETRPDPGSERGFCSRVSAAGKYIFLLIIIPPFLNYASLQREGLLLQPKGGKLIDIGLGQKICLTCKGQGQPVVMLDAPTGMSSDVWFQIQEDLSRLTQVCTYDRAGLGFSKRAMQNETTGMEKVWGVSTTGRMVDDLHRLTKEAKIEKPFILVGSELGALNGRFYSHIHDSEVSDLVLIDPIPEDIFTEDPWQQYWYKELVPSLQAMQFFAATGLNRMLLIFGWMKQPITGEHISEDLIQRQKYLLSNPAHQSGSVDEHFFLNESVFQVREISKYKPLSSGTSVTVITGDYFDELLPAHLNEAVAKCQKQLLEQTYPTAKHFQISGVDRKMLYRSPFAVTKHLATLVKRRKPKQESH
ncbi:uncharacterized protein LOC136713563 [Amia ocellicauda]|uniref:uncharacterized protein LOC136713563 n=1 Tax=Amia ocellicauda TaxID=2972642 RepID=UPI003464590F